MAAHRHDPLTARPFFSGPIGRFHKKISCKLLQKKEKYVILAFRKSENSDIPLRNFIRDGKIGVFFVFSVFFAKDCLVHAN